MSEARIQHRRMPHRVGINEVARAAGVSRQTVSNVLNERGRFTGSTRERVLATVSELGYRPHHAAKSMRSRQTRTLAHPVVDTELLPHNLFAAQFLQALVAAVAEAGYSLLTVPSCPVGSVEDFVAEGRVDGVILADSAPGDPRVTRMTSGGTPFSAFGRTAPDEPQCWVDVDSLGSVEAATGHVLSLGHRRLAFLGYGGPRSGVWDADRERGFTRAMAAATRTPVAVIRVEHRHAPTAVGELLATADRPTAIVCGSDVLAAAVYHVAAVRGLRIGRDLAVTGFDGGAATTSLIPSLTTLRQPTAAIARELVRRVLCEIAGTGSGHGLLLPAPLVVGESTDAGPGWAPQR